MAEPDVVQVFIRGLVVGLFQTNCYIVGSRVSGEAVCIDPGDQTTDILALARDLGVRITRLVSTHAHLDHVLAVGDMKAATGATFLLHPADHDILMAVPDSAERWLGERPPSPPEPDFHLADDDDLELDGTSFRVIHTPGHTPGSVSLYARGVLFSGDTLFRDSIGRTDLPGGDPSLIIHSITRRLMALPDDTVVLPGHMQQTTIGAERQHNPWLQEELGRLRSG